MKTASDMASVGATVNNNVLVYMLLNSISASFEHFEVAISTREKLPDLSVLKLTIEEEVDRQSKREKDAGESSEAVEQVWMARNGQQ